MRAAPYAFEKILAPMHDPSFQEAMRAFVRAAEQRTPATPTLGDGVRALAVIEAAERSATTGQAIDLDARPATSTPHSRVNVPGA